MADFGVLFQFNFLKFYYSRDPNVRIGFSIQNLGLSFTGLGKELQVDNPLPTTASAGISVKLIKPITVMADITQPLNLFNTETYRIPYLSTGASFQFTDFLSVLAGFSIKGGNPRFSTGFEFEVSKIRFNFNYTLDFTSSFSPINKLSLSSKIIL